MNIQWNSQTYQDQFSFVPTYGEDVLSLITQPSGCKALDLGCGNGTLTQKLSERGYDVLGLDASEDMLALARREHPGLRFLWGDAVTFTLDQPVDLIFSNAVFHWIDEDKQQDMIANIARHLTPGGELVCEFGGYGCGEAVHSTLQHCFEKRGLTYPRTFYFPTIGQYAPLLEQHGLRVEVALLFDRPTPQQGPDGLLDWIHMFVKAPFDAMNAALQAEIEQETKQLLYHKLCQNGTWYIDYVRIRLRARKALLL